MTMHVTMNRMTMQNDTNRVAERIRSVLDTKERSGRWLARQLGESPAWVQRRLAGDVDIVIRDAERIAIALNVDVTAFVKSSPAVAADGSGARLLEPTGASGDGA